MPKALSGCKVGPLGHSAENTRTRKENQGRKAKGIFPGLRGSQWGLRINQSARVYSSPPRKQQSESPAAKKARATYPGTRSLQSCIPGKQSGPCIRSPDKPCHLRTPWGDGGGELMVRGTCALLLDGFPLSGA